MSTGKMTLKEAIESDKYFRREGDDEWKEVDGLGKIIKVTNRPIKSIYKIDVIDVIAEDWEVKNEKKKIKMYGFKNLGGYFVLISDLDYYHSSLRFPEIDTEIEVEE